MYVLGKAVTVNVCDRAEETTELIFKANMRKTSLKKQV